MKKITLVLIIIILLPQNIYAFSDSSHSTIVMDIDSGRILYQKDSNTKRLIASTTKIMTFLVALSYAKDKLDEKVTVGEEVLKMYGTNMYLSIGEELTLRDLLYGLMLRSGNDAAVVIATYVGGGIEEFVELMNLKAKEIGMNNTVFNNPHGLDEETKNYSTAYDLGILTRYLYLNYPLYREIAGSKYYDFKSNQKSYSLINRCKIIFTYKNITTSKNGYTPLAGKSLVTTASNNNLNLLIVTIDDFNIYENHEQLYEYFFDKYENVLILDKNKFKVPNGLFNSNYYINKNFLYPLTINEKDKIETKIIIEEKNNILGRINVLLNNKIIYEDKIYRQENLKVSKPNIFEKIITFIRNIFN